MPLMKLFRDAITSFTQREHLYVGFDGIERPDTTHAYLACIQVSLLHRGRRSTEGFA